MSGKGEDLKEALSTSASKPLDVGELGAVQQGGGVDGPIGHNAALMIFNRSRSNSLPVSPTVAPWSAAFPQTSKVRSRRNTIEVMSRSASPEPTEQPEPDSDVDAKTKSSPRPSTGF